MLDGKSPSRLEQLMLASIPEVAPRANGAESSDELGRQAELLTELAAAQTQLKKQHQQLEAARRREADRIQAARDARARIVGLTDRLRAARHREDKLRADVSDLRARLIALQKRLATGTETRG